MLKKCLFGACLLIALVFSGCQSVSVDHQWGKWLADDGITHSRVCKEDFTHTETKDHEFKLKEVIKEASDLSNGRMMYVCDECGYEKIENIPPTGKHNFTLELEKEECIKKYVSSATAVYYKSCADCGAYGNDEYLFERTHLPKNYLEIEYVEGTGNTYIDTGFKANDKTRLVVKACYTQHYSIYGGSPGCLNFTARDPAIGYFYSGGYDNGVSQQVDLSKRVHVFEQNKNKAYVDGELFHVFNYIEWQDKNNLYLFARNQNGRPDDSGGSVKIYYFQLYDNDTLIRDFVPVLDLDTNEIGFYDLVTELFYSNNHGFLGGEIIDNEVEVPNEYTQVEFIEGTGQQFINTEVLYDDCDMEIDIKFSFNMLHGYSTVLGCQVADTNLLIRENEGKLALYHKNFNTILGDIETNKIYDIGINVSDTKANYSGSFGEGSYTVSADALTNKLPIYLFDSCCVNPYERGSSYSKSICSDIKLYKCVIKKDGVAVRNFIPCVRNIDGVVGLYDIENGRFYTYTQGFNYGSLTGSSYKNGEFKTVEYIESNGGQYINTGIIPTYGNIKIEMSGRYVYPADNQSWFGIDEAKFCLNAAHTSNLWQFGNGGKWCNFSDSSLDTLRHDIVCYYGTNNQYIMIDGETKYTGSEVQKNASSSITIFCNSGNYSDGTKGVNRYFTAGELYYFKIYNNDILVRDFVPVVCVKTGEAGLYDLVGEKFYTNCISNTFSGGEVAGHDFDEGVVVKEVTHAQNGDIMYTCNVCGKQIHKIEECYSYKISFDIDENIKEVKVFKDYNPLNYDLNFEAYSINGNTFNYSKVNAIVIIEVICKDGYEIEMSGCGEIVISQLPDGRYLFTNIHSDKTIKIESKIKDD